MDINFKCRHCDQDLSVDDSAAGSEIQCPSCGGHLTIPASPQAPAPAAAGGPAGLPKVMNPMASSAAAKEDKHFKVPIHDTATESLIAKPARPLDAAAKEGVSIVVKCFRHSDCVEVGKDHFDEVVTTFLNKIGESHIIKIETFNYTHQELASRQWVTDYGIMILYRSGA